MQEKFLSKSRRKISAKDRIRIIVTMSTYNKIKNLVRMLINQVFF